MSTVKVLLEVEIDNTSNWLGLEDYKKYEDAKTDLDALNIAAEMEDTTPLNLLVNLCDNNSPSKFVAVESGEVKRGTKIAEALEWLSYIPLHVKNESHHGGHIMHFLNNATRCLEKVKE